MSEQEKLADTSWYSTPEAALEVLAPGARYEELAHQYFLPAPEAFSMERMALQALLVRLHGLHRGVWLGLADDNPWAVMPVLRAMFELEVAMLYVSTRPAMFTALVDGPSAAHPDHPRLPKPRTMLAGVRDDIPAGAAAYKELSDLTHVAESTTWMAHTPQRVDGQLIATWSPRPSFRPGDLEKVAGQFRELIEGCVVAFERLVVQFLEDGVTAGEQE